MSEPQPFIQFGSSETVSSATFLKGPTTPLLVAGMSAKWLRVFDPRNPSSVATWGSRAVNDIQPNPFDPNQFAAHGDDGIVRLFDLRFPMDNLMAFSEADAGAVGAGVRRTGIPAKPLSQIAWSPTRRGVMTTLERDSAMVRVWQLADGPIAQVEGDQAANLKFDWQPQGSLKQAPLRLPYILGDERREPAEPVVRPTETRER